MSGVYSITILHLLYKARVTIAVCHHLVGLKLGCTETVFSCGMRQNDEYGAEWKLYTRLSFFHAEAESRLAPCNDSNRIRTKIR